MKALQHNTQSNHMETDNDVFWRLFHERCVLRGGLVNWSIIHVNGIFLLWRLTKKIVYRKNFFEMNSMIIYLLVSVHRHFHIFHFRSCFFFVAAHREMRTITNYFLLNLSIADLMMSSLNCMFNFIYMLNSDWPFGRFYCSLNNFMGNVTVATSVFTLVAISFDR